MITSPYNFVPLNEKVVMPFWAKYVSHDIPFEDSQSGILKLSIKAESPIYVRNGVPRSMNENDPEKNEFNHINNRYFIPGSSIKGMIRSVVEIMSFGRMGNKVNDDKYSVRDFQNNDIYKKTDLSNKVECGWLYKKEEEFLIDKCGKPGRISHKNLDDLCNGMKISSYYKKSENISDERDKSAKAKYEEFPFLQEGHRFVIDYEDVGRVVYKIDNYEGRKGTIVMSGQPGVRKEPQHDKASGKHLEFIFFPAIEKEVPVRSEVIKNFFFAYYDHEITSQKEDWKWRKKQLNAGEKIPVFFQSNEDGTIKDMGLSMLYKITYNYSVGDLIKKTQKDANYYDLAETIFGYTEDNSALKGRVQVGHAFVTGNVQVLSEKTEVLAGPKASYYPNYIEQNTDNEGYVRKYKTYMDEKAKIRGWKRYPVRNEENVISNSGTVNVSTKFIPLSAGTEFILDIHYHNLRKEELGALISAITFHNTPGLYHSIGSAKPLGYGKVSLELSNISEEKKEEMLKSYETFMDFGLGNSTPLWFQSKQLIELFAMARPGNDDTKLKYMKLEEFAQAKGKKRDDPKFALQRYSFISGNRVDVASLNTPEELAAAKKIYAEESKLFESLKNIHDLEEKLISESRQELQLKMEEKKHEWLLQLRDKREEIIEKEKKEKQEQEEREKLKKAQSGLPAEWHNAMGFNNIANRIPKWQKKLTDEKVPEEFKRDLFKLLKEIILSELSNSKTKRNWKGSFENMNQFGKITEWLGESLAKKLYQELFTPE